MRAHKPHVLHPNFTKEIDGDGICWLTFNMPNTPANVWNSDSLDELDCHVEALHHDCDVRAVVIRSAKERVFIAGADLRALQTSDTEAMRELLALGQDVFTHLETLRIPKIAAIHGACLGGGFEMTLACDWRIASDAEVTRIGLPETQIGLIPAWGGCTRLPRLIGVPRALDLIVRGKLLAPREAKRLGLIHEVTAREHLDGLARKLAIGETRVRHHHFHFTQLWPLPQLLRLKAKAALRAKFPWMGMEAAAPVVAVDVVTHGAARTFQHSLALEQTAMARLASSPVSRSFMNAFLRKEAASKHLPARLANVATCKINHAAVIGAGVMGSGIAFSLARKGVRVLLNDTSTNAIAHGIGRIDSLLADGVKRRSITRKEMRDISDRITPSHEAPPMRRMDIAIEAAFENMDVKKQLLASLASRSRDDTILASNTSALSVTEMCTAVPHPERIIGLHFFNPAHLMPLVEVVTTESTTAEVAATAVRFVQDIGKTPVLVKDRPGFVVNRILMPYLMTALDEAHRMRDPWMLDEMMTEFGMPMGPLRLLDEIGFDVALHVAETLQRAFPERMRDSPFLRELSDAGMRGRKGGGGFYIHDDKDVRPNPGVLRHLRPRLAAGHADRDALTARMVTPMRKEAQRCLDDGMVTAASDIELAMMLGAGFPPFQKLL